MKLILFLIFLFSHAVYFAYNLWVAKYAGSREIFGITFSSFWTFTLGALIIATPVLSLANYFFAIGFHLGHKELGTVWMVIMFFLAAQVCTMALMPILFFGEIPGPKMILGAILAFAGLFLTLWGN